MYYFTLFFNMKFHVEIHEFSCIRNKNDNLKFINFIHEIPGRNSWNFHGIFFDPELRKILVGTFYSGN